LTIGFYPGKIRGMRRVHFGNSGDSGSPEELQAVRCTAFAGHRRIAAGELMEVVRIVKAAIDQGDEGPIVIFDDETGELVEVDFRGTTEEVLNRLGEHISKPVLAASEKRGPGRPRLGVVAREITLLPRHWEWLDTQPGGASAALRRLVEQGKRSGRSKDRARRSQEAVYRFMSAMAGDLPDFEEALRSFYRQDLRRFEQLIGSWPEDIGQHLRRIATVAFQDQESARKGGTD
jgi:hypothetical protein